MHDCKLGDELWTIEDGRFKTLTNRYQTFKTAAIVSIPKFDKTMSCGEDDLMQVLTILH